MASADHPGRAGRSKLLAIGPIKVKEIVVPSVRHSGRISNDVSIETVPFHKIRHLCSSKPLCRYSAPGPADRGAVH
jgi:hypothetical protein